MNKKNCPNILLSFDFKIDHFEKRVIKVTVNKQLKSLNNLSKESRFNIFMEDLIYFINQSGIQIKWDVEKIIVNNLKVLKINTQEQKYFLNQIKTISSWNVQGAL